MDRLPLLFPTYSDLQPIENGIDKVFDVTNPISQASMKFLLSQGVDRSTVQHINIFFMLIVALALTGALHFVLTWIFRRIALGLGKKMPIFLDFRANKLSYLLAIIVPFFLLDVALGTIFEGKKSLLVVGYKVMDIYWCLLIARILSSIAGVLRDFLRRKDEYRDKPLDSFAQVVRIVVWILAIIAAISTLLDKDMGTLFTGLGAFSAVLLLVFKDSIVGFVASIQVATNDMVRIGDWITIPSQGVDGNVTEISLTRVKVSAFDNTTITIPTYALISNTVQNWRGMSDSGVRRIKRAIYIKQSTVRFATEEDLVRLSQVRLLEGYIQERGQEILRYNREIDAGTMTVNGRRFTNLGLLEKYIDLYLKQSPLIDHGSTTMVRQLHPTDQGLPVEIYCFVATTEWVAYEAAVCTLFDHIIAVVPYFGLKIFETISDNPERASLDTLE